MRPVILDVPLAVKHAAEARQVILDAFQAGDSVSLRIPDGSPIDLCGLQLIEAARRHAADVGKVFVLEAPGAGLRDILEDAGFLTDAAPETLQFWLHEGPAQ